MPPSLTSQIAWTHFTWNPWQGCSAVSAECDNCYMFRDKRRYGQDPETVVRSKGAFSFPLARYGARPGGKNPPRVEMGRSHVYPSVGDYKVLSGGLVFTCSWSDFFHKDADAWRDEAWKIMESRPDVIFQVLTKRANRIKSHLPKGWDPHGKHSNIWLGVTGGTQRTFNTRVRELAKVDAHVRFVSMEPMLEAIDITPAFKAAGANAPDWLILGGESGFGYRPLDPTWAINVHYSLITKFPGTAFFFKQWGGPKPDSGGHLLEGVQHQSFPSVPGWTRGGITGLWYKDSPST